MRTTIVLGLKKKNSILENIKGARNFFLAQSIKDAHLYHIENPDVDSYLIYSKELSIMDLETLIKHIQFLNAIITILVCQLDDDDDKYFAGNNSIKIVKKDNEIPPILKNLPVSHRDSNRVQWPLKVQYRHISNSNKEDKQWGFVLSISSSGCYIRTEKKLNLKAKDSISMTFHFKNFDFYTEGTIVRLKIRHNSTVDGIAVKFNHVSPQTQKCIKEIINEKILAELMDTLNTE